MSEIQRLNGVIRRTAQRIYPPLAANGSKP